MRSDIRVQASQGGYYLCKDIAIQETLRIGRVVSMMSLYDHERDLNRGRFAHFDRQPQAWPATVRLPQDDRFARWDRFTEMVNWIAEFADTPWSLDIVSDFEVDEDLQPKDGTWTESARFSFEDSHLGFMFKMVFG